REDVAHIFGMIAENVQIAKQPAPTEADEREDECNGEKERGLGRDDPPPLLTNPEERRTAAQAVAEPVVPGAWLPLDLRCAKLSPPLAIRLLHQPPPGWANPLVLPCIEANHHPRAVRVPEQIVGTVWHVLGGILGGLAQVTLDQIQQRGLARAP